MNIEIGQADRAAGAEFAQRARETREARLLVPHADPRAELETLDRDWPQLHAAALHTDTTTERTVDRPATAAEKATTEAGHDRDRARGLREEAELRAALPADRLAAEDAIRVDLDREHREHQAQRQRAERQQQQWHRRPPTPAGPDRGRGFSP